MTKPTIFLLLLVNLLVTEGRGQTVPPNPPGRLIDVGGYRLHLNQFGRAYALAADNAQTRAA